MVSLEVVYSGGAVRDTRTQYVIPARGFQPKRILRHAAFELVQI